MNKPKVSRIFKVTFKDGLTHYGRITKISPMTVESYIKSTISLGTFHKNNPHIHTIVEFEEKVINGEVDSCEIVLETKDTDLAVSERDTLIKNDTNCMNFKKSLRTTSERNMNLLENGEYFRFVNDYQNRENKLENRNEFLESFVNK